MLTSKLPIVLVLVTLFASRSLAQANQPTDKTKRQSVADAAAFVGCYELDLGRWWPLGFFGGDNEFVTPRIKLLLELGTEGFEQGHSLIRGLPPRNGEKTGRRRPSYWLIHSSTKMDLVWFNGFSGVTLSLEKHGDEFRGRAHAHFDTPTLPRFQRVTARRIPCDSSAQVK